MKKLTIKLLLQMALVMAIWVIGIAFGFNSELEIYGLFILVTLMPIIGLFAYRYKRKKEINSLHKIFSFFTSFYIVVSIIIFIVVFIEDYPYYLEWWNIKDLFFIFIPLTAIVVILFILKKISTSLIPKDQVKENNFIVFIKNNKETSIAILTIILVLVIITTILINTQNKVGNLYDLNFSNGEQIDFYVQNIYNNAYKKVMIFGSLIISSGFLLIYSIKQRL